MSWFDTLNRIGNAYYVLSDQLQQLVQMEIKVKKMYSKDSIAWER